MLRDLPLDLWIQVLDHLPDPADLKSFRLASRRLLRAESLRRRSLRPLRLHPLPRLLRHRYPNIDSLDLSLCASLSDSSLLSAAPSFPPALRSIDLSRSVGISWKGLDAVVSSCPLIERVDLSHCVGFGDREAAAVANAGGLREVRLDKCLHVTDVGLAKVAVGCARLERLGIKWCMEISDIGIELLVKKCPELKLLDVSYLKLTNRSLQAISSLEKLEDLCMTGCPCIDDEGLRFLKNGSSSLRSIDVSRCDNVTSSGLISVIDGHKYLQTINIGDCFPELAPSFLSKLSSLKMTLNTLKLDGFQVSASCLQIIGLNCKQLVEISLSKCRGVTDEGMSGLVSSCTDLNMIDLTCCHLLTDNSLLAIGNHCKKLRCLRMESCALISDKGLDQISTNCSSLKEIDLTDCSINDSALKCLSSCTELMVLKLGFCKGITDKGLAHIGSNCHKLEELDLYRCLGVTDDCLASISIGCKKLKKLNLCYCTQITDRGMKDVGSLELLSDLELRGLVHVTSAGIAVVSVGCKSLTEIDMKKCSSLDDFALFALAQYSHNLRQINISVCPVTTVGLWKLLGSLQCLQDVKLVNLPRVSVEGFELGLRVACGRLKKLKLLNGLMHLLSPGLLQMLQASGCRIRWVNKPLVLV
ncbi:uncharacterized protein M6B38_275040 [Iris pallida]|uniref:F-box/LRR-repeat protein 15-like leucin rich repeat domain-containing protein n=1 Tax=Iris pallida TaxID=29817 RepID=A0AAX6I6D8_IRIPA|nr:Uncharacterized protein M6B38_210065 [Iris pallida]KAJ6848551.1 uncharacterized protein M6B38_275040 [Iris pallida]